MTTPRVIWVAACSLLNLAFAIVLPSSFGYVVGWAMGALCMAGIWFSYEVEHEA